MDLARRAAGKGKVREAIDILDRAAAAGRRSSDLLNLRGELNLALGDDGAAERDWRRAAQLDPTNASPRIALGRIYLRKGLWGDAIRAYREVLLRDPRNVDALLGLTDTFRRSGRLVGAMKLIEAASEVTADARIQQRWAQVVMESGAPDEAERALKRIVGSLQGLPKQDVLTRLAELYVSQSRYEEALAALQEARTIEATSEGSAPKTYDLLVEATDNLVRRRVSELENTLQQLDASALSREEALERAEATRQQLTEIDQLVGEMAVPDSRSQSHADRLYAYGLANEAAFNALAYIDLGLAEKRDSFAARWEAAQAEMARIAGPPSAGR